MDKEEYIIQIKTDELEDDEDYMDDIDEEE